MAEVIEDKNVEPAKGNDIATDIRQIRNGVMILTWIAVIATAIAVIAGIYLGVQVGKVVTSVNGGTVSSSNCFTQGGNDLSC